MIRIFLIIVVVLFGSIARAETIPATISTQSGSYTGPFLSGTVVGTIPQLLVISTNKIKSDNCPTSENPYYCPTPDRFSCNQTSATRTVCTATDTAYPSLYFDKVGNGYECPSGQNWTLNGANCTRPDCVLPQVRDDSDGQCKASSCVAGEATSTQGWANAWAICVKGTSDCLTGTKTVPSSYCDGTCMITVDSWSGCFPQGTPSVDAPAPLYCTYIGKKTGATCTGNTLPQASNPPVIPQKTPPCLPTEGVMTSSSGSVKCVPAGTPSAEKPVVQKQVSTENFPDGSSKTTEVTTTRDPATGAESKSTKVTNTPATGGGSGQAGTPGVTNGSNDKQVVPTDKSGTGKEGDGSSDFCAKNPNLQICKGDMNKEETQEKIRKLLDPEESANKDSIDAEKSTFEEKAAAHKEFIDNFAGKGQNDEGFMSWALLPEPPASACSPFTGSVGSRSVTLDWCDELAKIREIAGYMFYILTAFGLFRIFANSTGATS